MWFCVCLEFPAESVVMLVPHQNHTVMIGTYVHHLFWASKDWCFCSSVIHFIFTITSVFWCHAQFTLSTCWLRPFELEACSYKFIYWLLWWVPLQIDVKLGVIIQHLLNTCGFNEYLKFVFTFALSIIVRILQVLLRLIFTVKDCELMR